jgi:hypothetical protein
MNGRFQMQGGKNWILPKEIIANRSFWDAHGWKSGQTTYSYVPLMGPNGGSVAMDSVKCKRTGFLIYSGTKFAILWSKNLLRFGTS